MASSSFGMMVPLVRHLRLLRSTSLVGLSAGQTSVIRVSRVSRGVPESARSVRAEALKPRDHGRGGTPYVPPHVPPGGRDRTRPGCDRAVPGLEPGAQRAASGADWRELGEDAERLRPRLAVPGVHRGAARGDGDRDDRVLLAGLAADCPRLLLLAGGAPGGDAGPEAGVDDHPGDDPGGDRRGVAAEGIR